MSKRISLENIIQKFKIVHGNKYDYSFVDYVSGNKKVKIKCQIHGIFEQRPKKHIYGQGCKKCSFKSLSEKCKLTHEDFVKKSIKIHGEKYSYIEEYKDSETLLKIFCPTHGIFEQKPKNHLQNKGCKKCGLDSMKFNNLEFITKLKNIHGDNFDYSNVIYQNSRTKIKLKCKIHNYEFLQCARDSLKYNGCIYCNGKSKTNLDFINDATKVHGNFYNYELVNYINNRENIKIICPYHGIFKQRADNHLSGKGCQKCNFKKGEIKIQKILEKYKIYFIIQKRFSSCRYKRLLSFDFYLPEYNICIEFNGKQHYEPIEYWGGIEEFEKRKIRDSIKIEYCTRKNITLITIKYNENVEEILNDKLLCHL